MISIETLKKNSIVTDEDEKNGLRIYSYNNCSDQSSDEVRSCRGIVVDSDDNIVAHGLGYTQDYSASDPEAREVLNTLELDSFRFFESKEGAMIRVFKYNGKMYVTTHNKLNAEQSSWGSGYSFGNLFYKGLANQFKGKKTEHGKDLDYLDKICDMDTKQYLFVVSNNKDNRLVCDAPENTQLFHIGTYSEPGVLNYDDYPVKHIPMSKELDFKSVDDVLNHAENKINWRQSPGIVVVPRSGRGRQFRILNPTYMNKLNLRANRADLSFRYLELRKTSLVDELRELFPLFKRDFDYVEFLIDCTVNFLESVMLCRYKYKRFMKLPTAEHRIVKSVHLDPKKSIRQVFESISPNVQNSIVKHTDQALEATATELCDIFWDKYVNRVDLVCPNMEYTILRQCLKWWNLSGKKRKNKSDALHYKVKQQLSKSPRIGDLLIKRMVV